MSGHTPGPWEVGTYGTNIYEIQASRPEGGAVRIAVVHSVSKQQVFDAEKGRHVDVEVSVPEAFANAALMSAAHDLLEAARAAVLLYEHAAPGAWANGNTGEFGGPDEGEHLTARMMDRVRAAIAKAEGAS